MVEITYEPSCIGESRGQLLMSSASGGEYLCLLQGHCAIPKAQGPILVKSGAQTLISFKNVLNSSAVFSCVVDNPAFVVKGSETIGSKKTAQISVAYKVPVAPTNEKSVGSSNAKIGPPSKTGKLIITNQSTNTTWFYYLKYNLV